MRAKAEQPSGWIEVGSAAVKAYEDRKAALEKHEQLERPEVFEDFDSGLFPCAYQPIIEDNRAEATIIYES